VREELTAALARARLSYDRETGDLRWRKSGAIAGTVQHRGYRRIVIDRRSFYAHRLAWLISYGRWPDLGLDHINGDTGDNRLENLREATHSQNAANAKLRSDNLRGLRGTVLIKGRWYARVTKSGKAKYSGPFLTAEEANVSYCVAAAKIHGQFAHRPAVQDKDK
jgi:hypothetical protein